MRSPSGVSSDTSDPSTAGAAVAAVARHLSSFLACPLTALCWVCWSAGPFFWGGGGKVQKLHGIASCPTNLGGSGVGGEARAGAGAGAAVQEENVRIWPWRLSPVHPTQCFGRRPDNGRTTIV